MWPLVRINDFEGVKRAISRDPWLCEDRNKAGNTVLFETICGTCESAEILSTWLIEHGADVNAVNTSGFTPLMYACMFSKRRLALLLVQKGTKLDVQNKDGWTGLMFALRYKQPATAKLIVGLGHES